MSNTYPSLLAPLRIGKTVLKNRMLSSNASPHYLQGPEIYPAETYMAYMAGLAKNGAAIVTLQQRLIEDISSDSDHIQAFDINSAGCQNYLSQMAEEVHLYGSKILISTRIELPAGYSMDGGLYGRRPDVPPMATKRLPKEMIAEVIDNFVKRIRIYKNLGYDGVTMRVDSIMVPSAKPRDDEYGGSVGNRMRLCLEVYSKVKEVFGPDFITEAELAGEQPMGYFGNSNIGYTLEDTIEFAKLAEGKIDIMQLREMDLCKSHPTGFTCGKGENAVVGYSEAIKAAGCKIITAPIGGFQAPEYMEKCIAEGRCDMFGMARAFFADFEFHKKIREGRGEDIIPCIKCNKCHGTEVDPPDPWLTLCSVNPLFGLQSKPYRMSGDATTPKRVAVIGGGPTGMRAAIVAAERGHKVTLFEKTDYLGGQLYHAEHFSFKWPVKDYRDWCVRTAEKLGVEIRLNTEATPAMIEGEGFEAVVAATGAVANLPAGIDGLRDSEGKALYPTCIDVIGKEADLGNHVIIIGGSETGIETAIYLAQKGHKITMLTRQREIGHDCSKLHYITMAWVKPHDDGFGHVAPEWEKYAIDGIVNVTAKSVKGGRVRYTDAEGTDHFIEGDSVVICGGMNPCVDEALSFASSADTFFMVGDCNGGGNIQRGTREAWSRALMI